MSTERERKFFCDFSQMTQLIDNRNSQDPHFITQHYLTALDADTELRIRRTASAYDDNQYAATRKVGHGEYRDETEISITPLAYRSLGELACASLYKERYTLWQPGVTLDRFTTGVSRLWGLIEAEQQPDGEDIGLFDPLSLGVGTMSEVTGQPDFTSRYSARELTLPEAQYGSYEETSMRIRELLKNASQPVIVTLGGPSASGKSTLLERFKADFGDQCTTISTDNYYIGKTRMRTEMPTGEIQNFDHPAAIDTARLARHLQQLHRGETIELPWYDMKTSEPVPYTSDFSPSSLIIVEGIVANQPVLRELSDLSICLTAPLATRLERRAQRDTERKGYDYATTMANFLNLVEPSYQAYHAPEDAHADITLQS